MANPLEKKIQALNIKVSGQWVYDSSEKAYINKSTDGVDLQLSFKQSTSYSVKNRIRTESGTRNRVYVILFAGGSLHYLHEKAILGESKISDEKLEKATLGVEKYAASLGIENVNWAY